MTVPGQNELDPKCSVEVLRRPLIKQPTGRPKLVVCVPIGGKDEDQIFTLPKAGELECHDLSCPCPMHGKTLARTVRNQGLVSFEWAMNHMQIVVPLNTTIGYLAEKGKLSGLARDFMTERALELGPEYIFYWDDDVIIPPHTFYQMQVAMERDPTIGLLTGVVCTREDPTEPLVYRTQGQGAWWNFSIDPNHPPQDIHGAGGGCLMVRVEALKKMSKPYWADIRAHYADPTAPGGTLWGHDIYFITKLRVESGFRTCVMGSVLCGHWDVERQKLYELPKDAPPYLEHRPPQSPRFDIQESPPISPEYIYNELRTTDAERRLFLIPKVQQTRKAIREALTPFFSQVQVVSVDSRWLAIGENLKDGWHYALSGHTPNSDQHGNGSGHSGDFGGDQT